MRSLTTLALGAASVLEQFGADSLLAAARRSAAAFGRRARSEAAARRAARELAQLDDRTLRDIGVERWQIDLVVRRGRDY